MGAKTLRSSPQEDSQLNETLKFVEELKRQWMTTIDSLVDPLMIVGEDYRIQKANRALAEVSGEEDVKDLIGRKCYSVLAGRRRPCQECKMQLAMDKRKAVMYELKSQRDGRDFEVTSQPIYGQKKQLEGVVQVYRDRTESKQLQKQLAQSEKLASIGLLAGGIAHEINNPLGGILVFSQMLLRELPKDSTSYLDVKEIEQATLRCKEIVENLLEFARAQPTSKKGSKVAEPVDIREVMDKALEFTHMGFDKLDVEVKCQIPKEQCYVAADKNKLMQVFLNLTQNAYQAMPKGGKLTITKSSRLVTIDEKQVDCWQIAISDTGSGIKKENLKKVFDPFFTTKETGQGTGLGLAICYGIIKDFGGEMDVESTYKKGTTFRVFLPKAK